MGIVFGATTADSMATGTDSAVNPGYGKTGCAAVVCTWFNPNALTAGRYIWGCGATIFLGGGGCSISATTGELALVVDRGTTDSVHTTSGLGLETNKWYFVAVLQTLESTTGTTSYRVWRGAELNYPTAVSIAETTAGVGGVSQSSIVILGNTNPTTRTKAFTGEIGRFDYVYGEAGILISTTDGTITNSDADTIYTNIVIPIWSGQTPVWQTSPKQIGTGYGSGATHEIVDLNSILSVGGSTRLSTVTTAGATVARQTHNSRRMGVGTTTAISAKRQPVPIFGPPSMPNLVRRR